MLSLLSSRQYPVQYLNNTNSVAVTLWRACLIVFFFVTDFFMKSHTSANFFVVKVPTKPSTGLYQSH